MLESESMVSLPEKIDPCPIKEAVFEIRFSTNLPPDAIYGVVYNKLNETYPESESLPIMQIPEAVRTRDVNLLYQPYYRMKNGNFLFQLGSKMMSLSVTGIYCGWDEYKREILEVFNKIKAIGFISQITRIGLRYVNTFETDILERIDLQIKIKDSFVSNNETYVRTVFEGENFTTILQIASGSVIKISESEHRGSLIDIDVIKSGDDIKFFENMEQLLDGAHLIEKKQFFELLSTDFLQSLNPVYGGE